jgi:ABC-type transport system substrate-binding protein
VAACREKRGGMSGRGRNSLELRGKCVRGAQSFSFAAWLAGASIGACSQEEVLPELEFRPSEPAALARFGSVDPGPANDTPSAPNSATSDLAPASPDAGTLQGSESASNEEARPGSRPGIEAKSVGGSIVIGVRRLPSQLDPLSDVDPWGLRIVQDLVFEGLVARAPEQAPWVEPRLADRWELDDAQNPHVLDFRLRLGATFHDGTAVTAEDVVYSVSRWLDARRANLAERMGLDNIESVEALAAGRQGSAADGDRWIRIRLKRREPLALETLSLIMVVPKPRGRNRPGQLIGTGPMRAKVEGDRVICERTLDMSSATRRTTGVERIVFRLVVDGSQGLTWLRRGEIDILAEVSHVHLPLELTKPGMAARFSAFVLSPPRYDLLIYNMRSGPGAHPGVRSALDEAVPLQRIAQNVYRSPSLGTVAPVDMHEPTTIDLFGGQISEGRQVFAGLPTFGDLTTDAIALARSAQALTDLGWIESKGGRLRDGNRLRVALMWDGTRGLGVGVSALTRAAWRRLGVADYHASVNFSHYLRLIQSGRFDVALIRLAVRDDADLARYFHSRGNFNLAGVADAQLDSELEAFQRARNREERLSAEAKIAQRLSDLRVVTVVHAPTQVMLARRDLEGWSFEDDLPRLDRLRWVSSRVSARSGLAVEGPIAGSVDVK